MTSVARAPLRPARGWRARLPSALTVAAMIVLLIVLAPLVIVFGAALNAESMSFPPRQWTLDWMIQAVTDGKFVSGALHSVVVGLLAAGFSTLFALPLALLVGRLPVKYGRIISLAFLGPLLIPTIIFALALYQVMIFTLGSANPVALIIGHVIITLPFPMRTITAAAEGLDPALGDAATSVGSTPFHTFRKITFPLLKPGVVAGFLFAFLISWNDFPVSVFLTPYDYPLLPIQIYEYLLYDYKPLIAAVAAWSVIGTGALILVIDRLVGLDVFIGKR